jgi:NAD(P)H dehydrogenase (quinone)
MILISGAAGKTGKSILNEVAKSGLKARALVYRSEQVDEIAALGAEEILVGDMRNKECVRCAVLGVDAVYHICPNVAPDEIEIGQNIIDAASENGVGHFVYHSVLHPQVEAMPHHWKKMRVEEYLFKSGLSFTILQPAVYMQNLLVNLKEISETGKYSIPYDVNSRISMVDLKDVAEAAAAVLTATDPDNSQPAHEGATYELTGTKAISQNEIARVFSQHLGHSIVAEEIAIEDWKNRVSDSGLGDYQIDALIKMFDYYAHFGLIGNTRVLEWLLGRPATSFDDFILRILNDRAYIVQ